MPIFGVSAFEAIPKVIRAVNHLIRRNTSDGLFVNDYVQFDRFDLLPPVGAAATGKDPHWGLAGTGTVPTPTILPTGGVLVATRTASAAQSDEARAFGLAGSNWADPILISAIPSGKTVLLDWLVKTDATITTIQNYAGMKLTDTGVIATDDDQVLFVFDTAAVGSTASANWQIVVSIAGTDTVFDTGVAVAASTVYGLSMVIGSDGRAKCFINGKEVLTTAVLTSGAAFLAAAGVTSRVVAGAARKIGLKGVRLARPLV